MRAARRDMVFSSDFIVGFPGESENDFAATLSLIDDVGYAGGYFFKYSARPGTPAAALTEQIPDAVMSERLARLQQAIERQQADFRVRSVGGAVDVLFERAGRYDGQLVGRSPCLQPVQVMAPSTLIGTIASVIITEVSANSLFGVLANAPRTSVHLPLKGRIRHAKRAEQGLARADRRTDTAPDRISQPEPPLSGEG
jgi:tRNA-2-methylthio-N6-dimethylallyladenosine synthase